MGAEAYFWVKSFHLLFVIAFLAGLFYLPRIFVHYAEGRAAGEDVRRLAVMARKLYAFTHTMFGLAFLLGLWLWLGYGITGRWLWMKLVLVAVLLAFLQACGTLLRRIKADKPLPSATALRWINELPLFVVLVIIYLVLRKPF